jgi:hypothetical protein
MFDRESHLIEALQTLAGFTVESKAGNRLKDSPGAAIRSFAHSWTVYKRLFPEQLERIDCQPLDELFELVKEIEAPVWEKRTLQDRLPWLFADAKTNLEWGKVRALASRGVLLLDSLPPAIPEPPIKRLALPVVYYSEERIDNRPSAEETKEDADGVSENDVNWYGLREELQQTLEKYGLSAPTNRENRRISTWSMIGTTRSATTTRRSLTHPS